MTDGASPGVHRIIQLLTRSESDSFLTPVPQYPLYSASLALYGTSLTPYYLDESINWGLNLEHLQEQYDKVRGLRSRCCPLFPYRLLNPDHRLMRLPASMRTVVEPRPRVTLRDAIISVFAMVTFQPHSLRMLPRAHHLCIASST